MAELIEKEAIAPKPEEAENIPTANKRVPTMSGELNLMTTPQRNTAQLYARAANATAEYATERNTAQLLMLWL